MSVSELSAPPSCESIEQHSGSSSLSSWRIGLFLLALLGAFLPRLLGLAWELWSMPQYQFFPIVLIGAVVLARARLREFGAFTPGRPVLVYPVLAVSWTFLGFAGLLHSDWLSGVAALLCLAAVIFAVGSVRLFRQLLPIWLFLWLAMPLPLGQDSLLVRALQPITTEASSRLLDKAGVLHVREGNLITVPGKRLFVDESCSGIHSLYSGLACTAFLLIRFKRGTLHSILLLSGAVGCVVAANVGRVTLVAWLEARWQLPVSEGWPHEFAGWLAFGTALALIASTDALLLFLLGCAPRSALDKSAAPPVQARVRERLPAFSLTALSHWPVTIAFCGMAFFQFAVWGFGHDLPSKTPTPELGEQLLAEHSGLWQRVGYEVVDRHRRFHELGASSQVWRFQGQAGKLLVSLDYPFPAWHDVVFCYKTQGWVPVGPSVTSDDFFHTSVQLAAAGGRRGYLWFGAFDAAGRDQPIKTLSVRLRDRLAFFSRNSAGKGPQLPVYQVQLFLECYHQLSADEKRQTEALFSDALERLKNALVLSRKSAP